MSKIKYPAGIVPRIDSKPSKNKPLPGDISDTNSRSRKSQTAIRANEHEEQKALFDWARENQESYPELASLYAIPNGGKRHIGTAKKLKAEGVKAGVPDVCLPCPSGEYSALYIEMKHGKNKPTKLQLAWHKMLRDLGNDVQVCNSTEAAIDSIRNYLKLYLRQAA